MSAGRLGYLGGSIIRAGGSAPGQVGALTVANIPRQTGLASHVANVKRQNIVLDAAVILARFRGFLSSSTIVDLSPARLQNFGATGGLQAAHAVKRFVFDQMDIAQVYARAEVDEVAVLGLMTMLGLVTDVHPRANLSIDKKLENNPLRVQQLRDVMTSPITSLAEARKLATELEYRRRFFDVSLLLSMQGGFGGDDQYAAMLAVYQAALAAKPQLDEMPGDMVDMIARLAE